MQICLQHHSQYIFLSSSTSNHCAKVITVQIYVINQNTSALPITLLQKSYICVRNLSKLITKLNSTFHNTWVKVRASGKPSQQSKANHCTGSSNNTAFEMLFPPVIESHDARMRYDLGTIPARAQPVVCCDSWSADDRLQQARGEMRKSRCFRPATSSWIAYYDK